jgi:hypothetical protein
MKIEEFRSLRDDHSIELCDAFPIGKRYYVPDGSTESGRDGVIVRFGVGTDHEWIGVFAFGELNKSLPSCVVPLPGSDGVLVVAGGDGYIVREAVPGSFEKVKSVPVRSVHLIPSHKLVALADDTTIVAYGCDGLRWQTERIGWHDLRIERIDDTTIHCKTFDIRSDDDIAFTVDSDSGKVHGGIQVI